MILGQRHHQLQVWLEDRPAFCCCCWCLSREDTKRARRVFRIVRALKKQAKAALK